MARIKQRNHFKISRDESGWIAKHKESKLEFSGKTSQIAYRLTEKWLIENNGGVIVVKDEFGEIKFINTVAPKVEPKNLFN